MTRAAPAHGWSVILTGLLLLLVINGLVVVRLLDQRRQDVEYADLQTVALSERLATAVEMYFEHFITMADAIGDQYSVSGMDDSSVATLLRGHKFRNSAVHEILIVDRHGVIAHWSAYGTKPDVRDRPYFALHARTENPERLVISEPLASRVYDGRWFVSVSRRRVNEAGRFDGSIAILLDLQSTAEFFQELLPAEGHEFRIVHSSGRVMATVPPDTSLIGQFDGSTDRTGAFAAMTSPVPGLPVSVAVQSDLAAATDRWARSARVAGLLLLGMNSVAGLLLWQYRRRHRERAAMFRALEEAKEAAQRATREKSRFLAMMSHEIRTPMSGVIGMLDILRYSSLTSEQARIVEVVDQSSGSLLQIINDILDFSKIEAGQLSINPEPTSIAALVEGVAVTYSGYASSKGLAIDTAVTLPAERAHLVDPLRLRQILSNLVSNAIKFTENGGIRLSVSRLSNDDEADGDLLRFEVSDTGIGIAKEAQRRLFEPFTQADATTTGTFGGTGLGLSICRRLADLMGGDIQLTSTPGVGTTVALTLKLAETDAAPGLSFDRGPRPPEHQPRRRRTPSVEEALDDGTLVLIADDHPVNRAILTRQLDMIGYAAEAAKDGLEALAMWRRRPYGLLITDINMPKLGGLGLAERIRSAEAGQGARMPIIVLSANVTVADPIGGRRDLIDSCLMKPVRLQALEQCLAAHLPLSVQAEDVQVIDSSPIGSSIIDTSALQELTGGDPAVEAAIVTEFLEANREDMTRLRSALDAADLLAVAEQAHRIKGASRTVGALRLAAAAEHLEGAAGQQQADRARSLVADLEAEAARIDFDRDERHDHNHGGRVDGD